MVLRLVIYWPITTKKHLNNLRHSRLLYLLHYSLNDNKRSLAELSIITPSNQHQHITCLLKCGQTFIQRLDNVLTIILCFFGINRHCLGIQVSQTFTVFIKSCISTMLTALPFAIQICLKMVLLLSSMGRYPVNNTYCANFVVTILAFAVIEGRAEDMC